MANVNNPRGFEAVQPVLRMRYYTKGTATAFYPGDAVSLAADGKLYLRATGNTTLAGVVMGYASATATSVLLSDHPDQQYYIKDDGVGGTLAQSNVGNHANIVMTTGSTTFLKSKQSLDTSTITATTAATQLRVLGFHPDDSIGKYVRCRVVFNPANLIQTRSAAV